MHLQSRRMLLHLTIRAISTLCFVAACLVALADLPAEGAAALSATELAVLGAGFVAAWMRQTGALEARLAEEHVARAVFRSTLSAVAVVGIGGVLVASPVLTSRSFLLTFLGTLLFLELASGFALRYVLVSLRRRGSNLRHVLIVGSGPRAMRLVETLAERPEYGYHIEGYVDDDHDHMVLQAKRLGELAALEAILDRVPVDEVFLCLPIRSAYDAMQSAIFRCEERGIPVHVPTDLYASAVARSTAHQVGEIPVLSMVSSGPMAGVPYMVKRVLDRVIAAVLLVLAAPLLAIVAGAIAATMGSPILFRQTRVGHHRRTFELYKFRTMVPDAEAQMQALEEKNEMDGPVFKLRDDPRITPLGHFLRRYSLDELPQLVNVLKGEMSLVGPRPLPLRDVERFDEAWLNRRFAVMPGLTCTWQVSGRNDVSFAEWIRMDLEYVDNWSLWRDLQLLARTVPAVFKRGGAY